MRTWSVAGKFYTLNMLFTSIHKYISILVHDASLTGNLSVNDPTERGRGLVRWTKEYYS